MMLTLLFISPRQHRQQFFQICQPDGGHPAGRDAWIQFPVSSPVRSGQLPVIFLAGLRAADGDLQPRGRMPTSSARRSCCWWERSRPGLISIAADSLAFTRLLALGGWENWILVINHLAATALLGSVMLTMVFGHWYLVIPRLSIDPLVRLTKV